MRRHVKFLCFLVAAILLTACNSVSKPKEFTSKAGGFSVAVPVTLTEAVETIDARSGKIDFHMFKGSQGNTFYIVAYADYPPNLIQQSDPEKILDGSRDGAVGNINGKLVIETRISLDGNPGRELVIDAKAEKGRDVTVKARVFLVKYRLYEALVTAPKGEVSGAEMDDFLRSFKLSDK